MNQLAQGQLISLISIIESNFIRLQDVVSRGSQVFLTYHLPMDPKGSAEITSPRSATVLDASLRTELRGLLQDYSRRHSRFMVFEQARHYWLMELLIDWLIDWLTDIHAEQSTQHLLIQSHEYCPNNFMKDCCLWILQYSFFLFLSHYYYNFSYFFSRHNFCQEVNWPTQWKRRLTSSAMDLFK